MKTDRKLMEEAIRRFLSNRCIENRMVAEAILFFIMCAGHGTVLAGESPVMGNLPSM